ncbi:MAG: gliding motility-associated C-terminal domain-containing protein [Bacteroidales bacterium]
MKSLKHNYSTLLIFLFLFTLGINSPAQIFLEKNKSADNRKENSEYTQISKSVLPDTIKNKDTKAVRDHISFDSEEIQEMLRQKQQTPLEELYQASGLNKPNQQAPPNEDTTLYDTQLKSGTRSVYYHPTAGLQSTYNGACMESINCGSSHSYYDNGGGGSDYSNSINMIYRTFCPDEPGQCVRATINYFSIEDDGWGACYDWLSIGSGPTQNSTVLWQGCGSSASPVTMGGSYSSTIISTDASGCLVFRFYSDGIVTEAGWDITLDCVSCAYGPNGTDPNDCTNAIPICEDESYSGSSSGPGISSDGCAGCQISENYATWYHFEVETGGTMSLTIDPVNDADDYDFALYQAGDCGTLGTPVRCSYAANTGNGGMVNGAGDTSEDVNGDGWVEDLAVNAGESYYLLVNNWSAGGSGFNLDWTLGGGGAMDCSIICPDISMSSTDESCSGIGDGTATVTITSGGSPNFDYMWSNSDNTINTSSTSNTITGLSAGTYTVSVYDAEGCEVIDNVTVSANPNPTANAGSNQSICNGNNITIGGSPTASGGSPPYSFAWSPSTGLSSTTVANPTASPTSTTSYTVVVSDGNGCTATDNMTVTVNSNPVADAGSNESICDGNNVTIGGSPTASGGSGSYTYSWSPSTGLSSTTVANPTSSPSSTTTYTIVVTDGNGCTATDAMTVTVNPGPTASAGSDKTICGGGNVTIGGSPTASGGSPPYSFAWSPSTGLSSTTAANPIASPASTTTYTVVVTDVSGCSSSDDVIVTVSPNPTASISPDPAEMCTGETLNLNGNPSGGSGTWSTHAWTGDTGNLSSTTIQNPTFSTATVGSYNLTYTVTDNNGCTATDNITVEVYDTPDPTITDPGDFCDDDPSANLTAASSGGTWSGTGITDASAGTFDPSVAGAGNHTITYDVGTGLCSASDNITITVIQTPDATITDPGDFCADDAAVNLTAATGGGTWSGLGITDASAGTFDPTAANIGNNTITYQVSNSGCTATDNITIEVFDNPDPTITDPGDFCSDDASTNLSAASSGGTWSGTGITDASAGTFDPSVAGAGNHTITYDVGTGTCSATDNITITVIQTPDATIVPQNDLCENDSPVTLSAATAGGTWSGTGVSGNQFDPATAGPGNHTITYQVNNGVCSASDNITIVIISMPDATINESGPYCVDDNAVSLSAATSGGTWSGTGIADATTGSFDPSIAGVGIHTITYTIINGACMNSDQTTVEVIDAPDASIVPAGPFCIDGAPVTLEAATGGGTWSGPGIIDAQNGIFDPSEAEAGSNLITYNVAFGNCIGVSQISITVMENADATILENGPFCYKDETVMLQSKYNGGVWSGPHLSDNGMFNIRAAGPGNYTISYTIDGICGNTDTAVITVYPSDFIDNYLVQNPHCYGTDGGSVMFYVSGGTPPYEYYWEYGYSDTAFIDGLRAGTYKFTVSDAFDCESKVTIELHDGERDCLRIPNAFTPNGDGVNDTWIIENLDFYPRAFIEIFNRWGQKLYEGHPDDEPWDGTTMNGKTVPTGTYIYTIRPETENSMERITGTVSVVK